MKRETKINHWTFAFGLQINAHNNIDVSKEQQTTPLYTIAAALTYAELVDPERRVAAVRTLEAVRDLGHLRPLIPRIVVPGVAEEEVDFLPAARWPRQRRGVDALPGARRHVRFGQRLPLDEAEVLVRATEPFSLTVLIAPLFSALRI